MTLRVVPFVTKVGRRAYRSRREIQPGETCYAVQHLPSRLYFVWSYTSRDFAEVMTKRLTDGPTDQADRDFNWRREVQATTTSSRETV